MATRAPQASSNRQGANGNGGAGAGGVDVGAVAVTRMAREDARWFAIAVVILSLVLFLALPMAVLIYMDYDKRMSKAEVKIEQKLRRLDFLEKKLREQNEKNVVTQPADAGGL